MYELEKVVGMYKTNTVIKQELGKYSTTKPLYNSAKMPLTVEYDCDSSDGCDGDGGCDSGSCDGGDGGGDGGGE